MYGKLLILFLCVAAVIAEDTFEETSKKIALKVYNDCSVSEDFSVCLKMKAVTFLERLGRTKKFYLTDGVTVVRAVDLPETDNNVTEDQLEKVLPRSADAKSEALNAMLVDKLGHFFTSRKIEVSMPRHFEEGRRKGGGGGGGSGFGVSGGGGGGGKGGKKGGGGMGMMMMLMGAKMYTLGSVALAALFFLAKKALIVAKIALVLSAIVGFKSLLADKGGDHGVVQVQAHPVVHDSYHGGYEGGWHKRSAEAQNLAYNGYGHNR